MNTKRLSSRVALRVVAAVGFGAACALGAGACGSSGTQSEAVGGPGGGGGGGGRGGHDAGGGGTTETAGSNVSFPIILSDNVAPGAFPVDGAWRFASITNPTSECVGEQGVAAGTAVASNVYCYYGRHVTVTSETGALSFEATRKCGGCKSERRISGKRSASATTSKRSSA